MSEEAGKGNGPAMGTPFPFIDYCVLVGATQPLPSAVSKLSPAQLLSAHTQVECFPVPGREDADLIHSLPLFCLPYGLLHRPVQRVTHHSFVLTDVNGIRRYASCIVSYEDIVSADAETPRSDKKRRSSMPFFEATKPADTPAMSTLQEVLEGSDLPSAPDMFSHVPPTPTPTPTPATSVSTAPARAPAPAPPLDRMDASSHSSTDLLADADQFGRNRLALDTQTEQGAVPAPLPSPAPPSRPTSDAAPGTESDRDLPSIFGGHVARVLAAAAGTVGAPSVFGSPSLVPHHPGRVTSLSSAAATPTSRPHSMTEGSLRLPSVDSSSSLSSVGSAAAVNALETPMRGGVRPFVTPARTRTEESLPSLGSSSSLATPVGEPEIELPTTLPTCIIIISHHPFHNLFRALLHKMLKIGTTSPLESIVWGLLYEVPLPAFGGISVSITLNADSRSEPLLLGRPPKRFHAPFYGGDVAPVFACLGVDLVVTILEALLLENTVLVHATSPALLTVVMEGILSLMLPFTWPYVYIPVLPKLLLETIGAPTQYFIGAPSQYLEERLEELAETNPEIIVVNLNQGTLKNTGATITPLPVSIREKLLTDIQRAACPGLFDLDDVREDLSRPFDSAAVRHACWLAMSSLVRGYTKCYDGKGKFDNARFLVRQPEKHRPFITQLLGTSIFSEFVSDHGRMHEEKDDIAAKDQQLVSFGDGPLLQIRLGVKPEEHSILRVDSGRNLAHRNFSPPMRSSTGDQLGTPSRIRGRLQRSFNKDQFPTLTPSQAIEGLTRVLRGALKKNGYKFPKVAGAGLNASISDLSVSTASLNDSVASLSETLPTRAPAPLPASDLAPEASTPTAAATPPPLLSERSLDERNLITSLAHRRRGAALSVAAVPGHLDLLDNRVSLVNSEAGDDADEPERRQEVLALRWMLAINLCRPGQDAQRGLDELCQLFREAPEHVSAASLARTLPRLPDAVRERVRPLLTGTRLETLCKVETPTGVPQSPMADWVLAYHVMMPGSNVLNRINGMDNFLFEPIRGPDACELSAHVAEAALSLFKPLSQPDMYGPSLVLTDPSNVRELCNSPNYVGFCHQAAALASVDVFSLSTKQRVCFWINVHNALGMHSCIEFGPPVRMADRVQWNKATYVIGGQLYSLSEIEHSILRGATSKPSIFGVSVLKIDRFDASDPRSEAVVTVPVDCLDFLMTFATASSPEMVILRVATYERQLYEAAQRFLASVAIEPSKGRITLPKLLEWYKVDYGGTREKTLARLVSLVPDSQLAIFVKRRQGHERGLKIVYDNYNWDFQYLFKNELYMPDEGTGAIMSERTRRKYSTFARAYIATDSPESKLV